MYRFGLNPGPDSRRNPARFGQFDRQWQSDFLWWISGIHVEALSRVFASPGHRNWSRSCMWVVPILGSTTNIDVGVGRTVIRIEVTRRAIVVVRIATEDNMPTGQPVPVHLP